MLRGVVLCRGGSLLVRSRVPVYQVSWRKYSNNDGAQSADKIEGAENKDFEKDRASDRQMLEQLRLAVTQKAEEVFY